MELHHTKHHQAYITNYLAAKKQLDEAQAKNDINKIISLASALRFNGGGHINHSIFWKNLSPVKSKPTDELACAIQEKFKNMEEFKKEFSAKTVAIQGSGWGWLGYNKKTKSLETAFMANQDPLEATTGLYPLLGFDVWEHAYYMQYKNVRVKYVEALWEIVNWKDISERYAKAQCA